MSPSHPPVTPPGFPPFTPPGTVDSSSLTPEPVEPEHAADLEASWQALVRGLPRLPASGGYTPAQLVAEDDAWRPFRQALFPGVRLNLNPGTLGTPSRHVRNRQLSFWQGELEAFPLGQYQRGRALLREVRALAGQLWSGEGPAVVGGTTATMNLLILSLFAALLQTGRRPPFRVLTSLHEHHGGIGGFERHPGFEVVYLCDEALQNQALLMQNVERFRPDVLLLSHLTWTRAQRLEVVRIGQTVGTLVPECFRILDLTQSVGLLSMAGILEAGGPVGFEVALSSAHKWLFGPGGTGFLWLSTRARERLGALVWAGEGLDEPHPLARFEAAGGQDFSALAGLLGALALYQAVGPARSSARSAALASLFETTLQTALGGRAAEVRTLDPLSGVPVVGALPMERHTGMISLHFETIDPYPIYQSLGEQGIHVKCIKTRLPDGQPLQLLRLGFPYYEEASRVGAAATLLARQVVS